MIIFLNQENEQAAGNFPEYPKMRRSFLRTKSRLTLGII